METRTQKVKRWFIPFKPKEILPYEPERSYPEFSNDLYKGIDARYSVYPTDDQGGEFRFYPRDTCEHYDRIVNYSDDEMAKNIAEVLHFVAYMGYVNKIDSATLLADSGLLHELIHVNAYGHGQSTRPMVSLRMELARICKPFFYEDFERKYHKKQYWWKRTKSLFKSSS